MTADGTASFNFKHSIRSGPIRWLIFGGMLLIAAITIGATIMADNFRERALNSRERELENTVLLLARHFDQQLRDFGTIQEDLVAYVQSAGIETGEQFRRRMSSPDTHAMLRAKIGGGSFLFIVHPHYFVSGMSNTSDAEP